MRWSDEEARTLAAMVPRGASVTPLDREGPTPIFQQIRAHLEGAIGSGELRLHQRIPSERELSVHYGVSRMTVRQALDALTQAGRLYSLPGKGTFVADRKIIEQPLHNLTSFTQDMQRRGLRPSNRTLSARVMGATLEVARLLNIPSLSEIVQVTRLRLADDEPLAIEAVHLPAARVPGLLDHDLVSGSLYVILRESYGIELARASQTIEAAEPSKEEVSLLGLDGPRPILRISRITFDPHDRVVEYVRSVYRGDRYHFTVELG